MMISRSKLLGAVVSCGLVVLAGMADASGGKNLDENISRGSSNLSAADALVQDSQEMKISTVQLQWEIDFATIITDFSLRYPDMYAYSEILGDRQAHVALTKPASQELKESLHLLGGEIVISEDSEFSEREVASATVEVVELVAQEVESYTSILAVPDPRGLTMSVAYSENPGTESGFRANSRDVASMVEASGGIVSDFEISVEKVEQEAYARFSFDGGWAIASGNSLCTMAFPVKRNGTGAAGLLTAGHCPGTGSYGGVNNAFNSPMDGSLYTTTAYPGGDFRWNWSKTVLSGWTYMGTGNRRFSSAVNLPYGSNVCKYGYATQYGCGPVVSKNATGRVRPHPYPTEYDVGPLDGNRAWIESGDSGGPFFTGNSGVGITHGSGYVTNIGFVSFYSRLPNALNRMGLSLLY